MTLDGLNVLSKVMAAVVMYIQGWYLIVIFKVPIPWFKPVGIKVAVVQFNNMKSKENSWRLQVGRSGV